MVRKKYAGRCATLMATFMRMMRPKKQNKALMHASTTSWAVAGVGAAVSGLGATMLKKKIGAGILGFGLAHVALGLLDLARPTIKNS
jgi:hypothetical protein